MNHGFDAQVEGLRESLISLRDSKRAPQGAPSPPDLTSLNKMEDLSPEGAVATAVKVSCTTAMNLTKKL